MNPSDSFADGQELARALHDFARDIAQCLSEAQGPDGSFPARDFYGKSFSALLWSEWPDDFDTNITAALGAVGADEKRQRGNGKYHFEFNRYALLRMALPLKQINRMLGGERYARTRVANWTLLRAVCRLQSGNPFQRLLGRIEAIFATGYYRTRDNFIEDQRGAFTAQYHFLCVHLLFEIGNLWPRGKSARLNRVLRGATDNICRLTMPNGDCNYLGRGKFQSFGYGAAILALCQAYRQFGDAKYLETAERIFRYVATFRRDDGSLPLVLSPTGRQEGPPDSVDRSSPEYAGWYSYNNYYDYLPFVGALFSAAGRLLSESFAQAPVGNPVPAGEPKRDSADLVSDILFVDKPQYRAVVCLPNETWAASQPLPFVGTQRGCPMPAFGGENIGGRHSALDIPTPVMRRDTDLRSCDFGSYKWLSADQMEGTWQAGRHHREFSWHDGGFVVRDSISNNGQNPWSCEIARIPVPAGLCSLDNGNLTIGTGLEIFASEPIVKFGSMVNGPDGAMEVYGIQTPLDAGSTVRAELRFSFLAG